MSLQASIPAFNDTRGKTRSIQDEDLSSFFKVELKEKCMTQLCTC